ncbi:AAA family ATPase [Bacillus sp. WC2507]|uniref:AAA family ATPase n=1 Tax=Bacillus sp. WC2507 TaxID=3461404 RepID=UPI0040411ED7
MMEFQNSFSIKTFKIDKLFGRSNVKINFSDKVKIFVGENGIGKTTILNILYYSIRKKFKKLHEFEFEKIEIEYITGEKVILSRNTIVNSLFGERITSSTYNELLKLADVSLNRKQFIRFRNMIYRENRSLPELVFFLENIGKVPRSVLKDVLNNHDYDDTKDNFDSIENFEKSIDMNIKQEVLYFPTYRRIEEDLKKLGFELELDIFDEEVNEIEDSELIKFGMDDVQEVFNEIAEEIKDSALKGYSRVTGEMITHLVHSNKVTQVMKDKVKEAETLDIVLDRVGKNLTTYNKDKIKKLIKDNELFHDTNQKYDPLIFFLSQLIDIYESNRKKEEAIKKFYQVCNKYLVNKEVKYNESSVEISIVDKQSGDDIQLQNLSSGEKQIVSLFTRIFLTASDNQFIVLFDEPELSLSIEWQERLLPDIVDSGMCTFLLAVTHSPFVYNNSLENYAQSIESCIEEVDENECQQ